MKHHEVPPMVRPYGRLKRVSAGLAFAVVGALLLRGVQVVTHWTVPMKTTRLFASFLLFISVVAAGAAGQAADTGAVALETRVPKFELRNGTVLDGLAHLSREPAEISFSFEEILRRNFGDVPIPEVRFDLRLEGRTVAEVLDALCSRDTRYTWSRDGLMINVYPRAAEGDSSYLMNRRLPQLTIKGIGDAGQAVFAIVDQLSPPFEQIAFAQAGGDTSYGSPWNDSFRDVTMRQAFNIAARHLSSRGGWVFNGSNEFRTIGFHGHEIHYNSLLEEIPAE